MNLASIENICDSRYNVCFSPSECFVQDHISESDSDRS